jgi:Rrf2 family transcriptional regulator, iron-sulfur cluster assembly transcription factor
MLVSKSFGYALRAALYLLLRPVNGNKVQAGDISAALGVPRYFLAKVLKKMTENGLIGSAKGPNGGYFANEETPDITLLDIYRVTDDGSHFSLCVLHFNKCNAQKPCPLHTHIEDLRSQFLHLLSGTTLAGLLQDEKQQVVKSIAVYKAG